MEKLDQAIFHVQKIEVEQYQLRNLSRVYVYLIPKEEKWHGLHAIRINIINYQ